MAKWAAPKPIKTRATSQGLSDAKPQSATRPNSTKGLVRADTANAKPVTRLKKGK